MDRIYKAFRFAYETKYWLDCLVSNYNDNLQIQLNNGLLTRIENDINAKYSHALEGVSSTITLNVTTGSIIDRAIELTKSLATEDWLFLAKEVEIQKSKIKDSSLNDSTPKVYILQTTYEELENLQHRLRGDNPRVPRKTYIIKLAVFYLYQQIFG
ncbi:MAG: hypothetical protein ACI4E3_00660 [Candidatus Fimousia sp.]